MKTVMLNGGNQDRMPKAVYFQCLWIIKDMERLENLREEAKAIEKVAPDEIVLFVDERKNILSEGVVVEACRKLDCIQAALEEIPEEYREGIIRNIKTMDDPGDVAHSNTWKYWKHRFIYSLAGKLQLY